MKAFENTPVTKERFLHHLRWHQEQDAIIKGTYKDLDSEEFKGCAVGCSLHSVAMELGHSIKLDDHSLYEKYLGIPEWLAELEDTIFEGLPEDRAKTWPVEFAEAINVGAELEKVKPKFLIMVLESVLKYVEDPKFEHQKETIENVIKLWQRNDIGSEQFKKTAARAAEAAEVATGAAARAARAAWNAARAAAGAAAGGAAWTAEAAEVATGAAARAAARATTGAAWNAWTAARAAEAAKYEYFADELLKMLRECK